MSEVPVAAALKKVAEEVAAAARASGRNPEEVQLLAVSKTFPAEAVLAAYNAGQRRFGESKTPELAAKARSLPADIEWHFIGHLQSNKVRQTLECAQTIHSVDSVKLLERIDRLSGELGKQPKLFLEVNVSGEASKFGMAPETVEEALAFPLRHARIVGLMTMAPEGAPKSALERIFSTLAELARRHGLAELSMGMSGDFPVAVACGATIVRVGSRIFGGRVYTK